MAKKTADQPQVGKRTRILDHSAKAAFWKPKIAGEHVLGKLVRIATGGEYGPSLRIQTATGTISVSVNVILADVDWAAYIGKTLDVTFTGLVGKRNARSYDVDLIEG